MDVNSIQNILRPSGWARRLITACIAILHMGVLYANIATIQRVGSTKWRPAGTTTTLPTTNQCRRPSTTTMLYEALLPPDEPRGPRGHTLNRPTAVNCAEHAAITDHVLVLHDGFATANAPCAPRRGIVDLRAERHGHVSHVPDYDE